MARSFVPPVPLGAPVRPGSPAIRMTLPRALQRALADAHRADRAAMTPAAVPADLGRLLRVTATTPGTDASAIRAAGGTDQEDPPSHGQ